MAPGNVQTEALNNVVNRAWVTMKSEKQARNNEFRHIARYVRVEHSEHFDSDTPGTSQPSITQLWDNTAIGANDQWARGVNSMSHNPATDWVSYKDKNDEVMQDSAGAAWYGEVNTDLKTQFKYSGLYLALLTRLKDVGSYGQGTIYSFEEGDKGNITFSYVPYPESYFTLDRFGMCRTHIRPRNWTVFEAIDHGLKLEDLSEQAKQAYQNKNYTTRFLFIHAVFPKADFKEFSPKVHKDHDFVGFYYEVATGKIVDTHGYFKMPYHVLSWDAVPQSSYSIGIGYKTLPDIRNVNAWTKKFDRILDNESDSPILTGNADEASNQAAPQPGEIVPKGLSGQGSRLYDPLYKSAGGSRSIKDELQDGRGRILEAWHNNLMLMISSHQMTAQEVASRDEKIVQAMGPFIIPMYSDLSGIVERVFDARMRAGAYSEPPEIIDADTEMEPEFTGILAKAAKKLVSANIFQLIGEIKMMVADVAPEEIKRSINFQKAFEAMADARATPAGILFTADEREANDAALAEQQQQQQAMEAAPGLAKAAKDGAQALGELSGSQGNEQGIQLAP